MHDSRKITEGRIERFVRDSLVPALYIETIPLTLSVWDDLDEPLRLFIPTRLMLALITVAAVTLIARVTSLDFARGVPILLLSSAVFVLVCEMIIPLAIVRRDPERVLEVLLPSFEAITRLLRPLTAGLRRLAGSRRDRTVAPSTTVVRWMTQPPREYRQHEAEEERRQHQILHHDRVNPPCVNRRLRQAQRVHVRVDEPQCPPRHC